MPTIMVSLRKHAKLILLRTQNSSAALIFKNVRTVDLLQELNQEIKETVGLNKSTQFGKLMNMEPFQELKK